MVLRYLDTSDQMLSIDHQSLMGLYMRIAAYTPNDSLHPPRSALQRQNAENLKQKFPQKEYWGLSPNFHIHVPVGELYISTMGLPFLLEEICRPILGIYKSLTDT
jgi:hypothetical protein